MNEFVQRHADRVIGCLSGFDRILFRGTQRMLANAQGLMSYLWSVQVLLKDFGDWSESLTARIRSTSEQVMTDAGRPKVYLRSPGQSKEDLARAMAERDGIQSGPVCLLEAVEPCWSYGIRRDRSQQKLVLQPQYRKCLHLYHYWMDEQVGLMHVRMQTWLPFGVRVCLNGREWLCRELEKRGIDHVRRDNCLVRVSDTEKAQQLLDEQLRTNWPRRLDGMLHRVSPACRWLLRLEGSPLEYYWSADQSEWATDVMFEDRSALSALYPSLVRHGMQALGSREVMRFLGKRLTGNFQGEVTSDLRQRPEGVRVKHRVKSNSVKMYDKQGSVLRVETTINDPRQFKVWRKAESNPHGKPGWQKLRKSVADLHRRARISESSNQRYFSSLATVRCDQTVKDLVAPLCRAVVRNGKRHRGLRPLETEDARLLSAVGNGRWLINGFRNGDIRQTLFGIDGTDKKENRRRSGIVTRRLGLLHAHGLIRKVPRTRRWTLSAKGRRVVTLLSAASAASAQELLKAAA